MMITKPTPYTDHWTAETRFLFDLNGWVAIPGVLNQSEIEACRAHIDRIYDAPESIESEFRSRPGLSGPLQALLDHPILVPILQDIISPDIAPRDNENGAQSGEAAYGFRVESNFTYRLHYDPARTGVHAHRGTSMPVSPHDYRFHNGQIYSGQTRVVWELNPVEYGTGGTRFLSGSHKSNLEVPDSIRQGNLPHFDTYACPAGTLLIFCEKVLHAGASWLNKNHPRMSVFTCYNHYTAQIHKMDISADLVMKMPLKRRTLFRGVWQWWNRKDAPRENNTYYAADNRSL